MIYNTNKYSFTQGNNIQDKIPNWMNDDFFNKLQESQDIIPDNFMSKTAAKYNEKKCNCCNKALQENEVNYCKACLKINSI